MAFKALPTMPLLDDKSMRIGRVTDRDPFHAQPLHHRRRLVTDRSPQNALCTADHLRSPAITGVKDWHWTSVRVTKQCVKPFGLSSTVDLFTAGATPMPDSDAGRIKTSTHISSRLEGSQRHARGDIETIHSQCV